MRKLIIIYADGAKNALLQYIDLFFYIKIMSVFVHILATIFIRYKTDFLAILPPKKYLSPKLICFARYISFLLETIKCV